MSRFLIQCVLVCKHMDSITNSANLQKLKYGIWAIALLWLASDFVIVLNNQSSDSSYIWLVIYTLFLPVAWWVGRLASHFIFADFLMQHARLLVRLFRKMVLFGSAVAVVFFVILKVASYTIAEPPNEPYPPAFGFLLFAGVYYFALIGKVDRELP